MNDQQIKVIRQDIASLQKTADHIFRDQDEIFKNVQELTLIIGKLVNLVNKFSDSQKLIVNKVEDKVTEAVAPVIEEAQDLTTQIRKKENVLLVKQKSLFEKLLRR